MRECGLKFQKPDQRHGQVSVTPRAGVWIEIVHIWPQVVVVKVTPRAGVWIEIRPSVPAF